MWNRCETDTFRPCVQGGWSPAPSTVWQKDITSTPSALRPWWTGRRVETTPWTCVWMESVRWVSSVAICPYNVFGWPLWPQLTWTAAPAGAVRLTLDSSQHEPATKQYKSLIKSRAKVNDYFCCNLPSPRHKRSSFFLLIFTTELFSCTRAVRCAAHSRSLWTHAAV